MGMQTAERLIRDLCNTAEKAENARVRAAVDEVERQIPLEELPPNVRTALTKLATLTPTIKRLEATIKEAGFTVPDDPAAVGHLERCYSCTNKEKERLHRASAAIERQIRQLRDAAITASLGRPTPEIRARLTKLQADLAAIARKAAR